MGLDIYSKKNYKAKDYFRFNWQGTRGLQSWCDENALPEPFPNWGGSNDGDKLDLSKPEDRGKVRDWLKAHKERFPKDAEMGMGESAREIMFRVNDSYDKSPFFKKEYHDWNRNTALAWSWFLKEAMRLKTTIMYW